MENPPVLVIPHGRLGETVAFGREYHQVELLVAGFNKPVYILHRILKPDVIVDEAVQQQHRS